MPTTLERTTVTHTAPVQRALAVAARHWPVEANPRELMLRLMLEGASALRERELEAAYADAYAEWADTEDASLWDSTSGDGLEGAA
ncbi:MAG: hypothetical protein LBI33_08190 [Propionibacteriaceae bacterium]|jgi:hypothetical protein|nr:hypothetical protein [Propionibacteriaceae bacterium]